MITNLAPGHIYHREIAADVRTSLSVIAAKIGEGARVLDLGTGSGALGKQLTTAQNCQVDGLTYNHDEAAIAHPSYRHIEVADLETCALVELFPGQKYDYIVCADVLEHIRNPDRLAIACKELLAPGGKLLISVPNLSYCGLVAELMGGEFLYRDEGLLDRTHVHFFTRRSLTRFLSECGWGLLGVEVIERPLSESEFKVQFDALPPAVARHLLALPDSMAYQFVASAKPLVNQNSLANVATETVSHAISCGNADFSCQIYFGDVDGFSEDRKLVARGIIGLERQTLNFSVPTSWAGFQRIRLDPADRVGYLHLYRVTFLANGTPVWSWQLDNFGAVQLGRIANHEVIFGPPVAGVGATLLLLTGNDPWIELPIPSQTFNAAFDSGLMSIQVELGWPMSADYLALSSAINEARAEASQLKEAAAAENENFTRTIQELNSECDRLSNESQTLRENEDRVQHALSLLREEFGASLAFERAQRVQEESAHKTALDSCAHELISLQTANNNHERTIISLRESLDYAEAKVRMLIADKKTLSDEKTDLVTRLNWIENSRLFRLTRPLIKLKMQLNPMLRKLQGSQNLLADSNFVPPAKPALQVDIVVPVYKGLEDTQRCINSVLASHCATPFRLVVINDASPESEVTQWLRHVADKDFRILLLENAENLGFVGTVNRGMSVSESHDVVLLNSDTEVANDWLDRLKNAAYISERVGTVTPFSNNATICSYPVFCGENPMVADQTTASLDNLFAKANAGEVVDIPTGVGFCMYIRRECLSSVGLFDVTNFGKGYGEENDFCRRAAENGWRNLHALDTFVLHAGGVSFGASKNARVDAAMQTMARLHPDYDSLVQQYLKDDPAASNRHAVDVLRIQSSRKPVVLLILHDRSGGTIRHALELAEHLANSATFLTLTPSSGGNVCLRLVGPYESFSLTYSLANEFDDFLSCLKSLGICLVHFHHLIGHHDLVCDIPKKLGVPYDFTVHDYYSICPQISLTDISNKYCGETGVDQCRRCLAVLPAPGNLTIEDWRTKHQLLLSDARFVLTPSQDVSKRISRFLPSDNVRFAPHTDLLEVEQLPLPSSRALGVDDKLRIVVVGALSPIKGADVLEDAAVAAFGSNFLLEFHLLGYAYRNLKTRSDCDLTVHGSYDERDLLQKLDDIQPHVVWFPALWPETYSYTLSACLLYGAPIVAPDIGAFPERLAGRQWTWIRPWDQSPDDWGKFFNHIRSNNFLNGVAPEIPTIDTKLLNTSKINRPWVYTKDYLTGCEIKKDFAPMSIEILRSHLTSLFIHRSSSHLAFRSRTLKALIQLRSMKSMSSLARAIPVGWQTRIKTWLNA